jgi:DNA-binding transcriptional regulator YiaG
VTPSAGSWPRQRDDRATGSATGGPVVSFEEPSVTGTSAAKLTERIGFGRSEVRELSERYQDLHKQSHFAEWDQRTAVRGKMAPADILAALGKLGFAWRDIARLVGASVAAVQKWRRGAGVSGDSRRRLASLLAACDLITEHYAVNEIASWFEMPLLRDVPVTPLDLYASGQHRLVFEYSSGHLDPEQVLTEFNPGWRERYRSDFEVYRAGDGELSIRPKDR